MKTYRRGKLESQELEKIFSADVFLGEEAQKLGLIDGVGEMFTIVNKKHPDFNIIDFSQESEISKLKKRISLSQSSI